VRLWLPMRRHYLSVLPRTGGGAAPGPILRSRVVRGRLAGARIWLRLPALATRADGGNRGTAIGARGVRLARGVLREVTLQILVARRVDDSPSRGARSGLRLAPGRSGAAPWHRVTAADARRAIDAGRLCCGPGAFEHDAARLRQRASRARDALALLGCSACLRPAVSCPCARWWASTTSPASLRSAVRAGHVIPRRRSGAERTASRLERRPRRTDLSCHGFRHRSTGTLRALGRWHRRGKRRHVATDAAGERVGAAVARLAERRRRAASARRQNAGMLRWRGVTVSLCPCAPTGTGRACCPRVAAPPLTPRRPRRGAPHDRRDRSTVRCPMT
jgi:hypothetical protein